MNKRRGFTLIEILVAMLALAMVVATVYSSALFTKKQFRNLERKARAHDYAKRRLEEAVGQLSQDYNALNSGYVDTDSFDKGEFPYTLMVIEETVKSRVFKRINITVQY